MPQRQVAGPALSGCADRARQGDCRNRLHARRLGAARAPLRIIDRSDTRPNYRKRSANLEGRRSACTSRAARLMDGSVRLYVARCRTRRFSLESYTEIQTQTNTYVRQKQDLRAYKRDILGRADADYPGAAFHDHLGRAVSFEAGDRADSGAWPRRRAKFRAGISTIGYDVTGTGRTGDAGAVVQSHDGTTGRRAASRLTNSRGASNRPSKSASGGEN